MGEIKRCQSRRIVRGLDEPHNRTIQFLGGDFFTDQLHGAGITEGIPAAKGAGLNFQACFLVERQEKCHQSD